MGFYDDLNNARVDSLRSTFNDNKDRLLQHVQKRYKEDFINGTDISTIYIYIWDYGTEFIHINVT